MSLIFNALLQQFKFNVRFKFWIYCYNFRKVRSKGAK